MGTRSTTHVFEINEPGTPSAGLFKKAKHVVGIYRQYDGYPDGHGKELADFASKFTIVNGFGMDMKAGTHANGAGCFAAQLVRHFKNDLGNVYITPKSDRQEYDYFLYVRPTSRGYGPNAVSTESLVYLIAKSGKKVLFSGLVTEYDGWLQKYIAQAENA